MDEGTPDRRKGLVMGIFGGLLGTAALLYYKRVWLPSCSRMHPIPPAAMFPRLHALPSVGCINRARRLTKRPGIWLRRCCTASGWINPSSASSLARRLTGSSDSCSVSSTEQPAPARSRETLRVASSTAFASG
ncbi:MAG: hypothetical protein GC204_13935 [Chloroflexi bacterium]|nr:hypothetical protein [Chloroflexota bacterium]